MADRSGIFAGDDPFALARAWLAEAEESEANDPNAIALATVDAAGLPNVRMVLLKEIEADAFVFYTNYGSAKAGEIDGAGKAAFVLHWKSLRRQIRVRGAGRARGRTAGGCLFRLALAEEPAWRLGLAPVAAAGVARGADGRGGAGDGREGARIRRGRRSGAAIGFARWRSSSGPTAPSGCTTASGGAATGWEIRGIFSG